MNIRLDAAFTISSTLALITTCSPIPQPQVMPATERPTQTFDPDTKLTGSPVETIPPYKDQPPTGALKEFITDFSIHSIPYNKVHYGGPGKDGIPVIDFPKFVSVLEADDWIEPQEPIIVVRVKNDTRAYPIQILLWHEVVNDVVGGTPLVITYCPLCNSGIAFERTVDGEVLDFGTTGRLFNSNLLMYDRHTESWWQQANGQAVIGEYTGSQLRFHPVEMVAWEDFKQSFPSGLVLSRDTGEYRRYDLTPYHLYDDIKKEPFFYYGPEVPQILPSMMRIIGVEFNGISVAYPYSSLEQQRLINDSVGGNEIVLIWSPDAVSALDKFRISNARKVGSAVGYSRIIARRLLTFRSVDGKYFDAETGSEWDIFGRAVDGPMTGSQLDPIIATNHFWFSWFAFNPETQVYTP
ncbi:MAG TPA: hypothetical protein DCX53_12055 [Anaerolineae bacterium]|nr:hypothetical protein [Anaerolineae bacterium]